MAEPIVGPKEQPRHPLTANNFTLEIVDSGMQFPNFQKVDGLTRTVETTNVTDGGVGLQYKFHGGIVNYEDVTLVRIADGSENNKKMREMVDTFIKTGKKFDATLTKWHHNVEVLKYYLIGLCFKSEQYPGFDNTSASNIEMSYQCTVDFWSVDQVKTLGDNDF